MSVSDSTGYVFQRCNFTSESSQSRLIGDVGNIIG